jgi:hypothetical protein
MLFQEWRRKQFLKDYRKLPLVRLAVARELSEYIAIYLELPSRNSDEAIIIDRIAKMVTTRKDWAFVYAQVSPTSTLGQKAEQEVKKNPEAENDWLVIFEELTKDESLEVWVGAEALGQYQHTWIQDPNERIAKIFALYLASGEGSAVEKITFQALSTEEGSFNAWKCILQNLEATDQVSDLAFSKILSFAVKDLGFFIETSQIVAGNMARTAKMVDLFSQVEINWDVMVDSLTKRKCSSHFQEIFLEKLLEKSSSVRDLLQLNHITKKHPDSRRLKFAVDYKERIRLKLRAIATPSEMRIIYWLAESDSKLEAMAVSVINNQNVSIIT